MIRGLLLVFLCFSITVAQIGEISSVVSNILGTSGNVAASGASASEAAANIGTLYQLAQTALQLTGTGVGILNQASEGRWFSDLTNNIVSNQRDLQDRLLTKGASPEELSSVTSPLLSNKITGGFPPSNRKIPPKEDSEELSGKELGEIGQNFKAPEPEDYEELKSPEPESLIRIDKYALTIPTSTASPNPEPITLIPDEKTIPFLNTKETIIMYNKGKKPVESFGQPLETRIEPVQIGDDDYYFDVRNEIEPELEVDTQIFPAVEKTEIGEEKTTGNSSYFVNLNDTDEVPTDIDEVIGLIRKSELNDRQIAELLKELLRSRSGLDKAINKLTNRSPKGTTPKSSVVVSTAHRKGANTDDTDSDLLSLFHAKIYNQVDPPVTTVTKKPNTDESIKPPESSTTTPARRSTKYPRRTMPPPSAYRTQKPKETTTHSPRTTRTPTTRVTVSGKKLPVNKQPFNTFTPPTPNPWLSPSNLWTPPTLPTPMPNLFTLQPQMNIFQQKPTTPATNALNTPAQSPPSAAGSSPVSAAQQVQISAEMLQTSPTKTYYNQQQYPTYQQYYGYYPIQQQQIQPFAYGQTLQQYTPLPLSTGLQQQTYTWSRPYAVVK